MKVRNLFLVTLIVSIFFVACDDDENGKEPEVPSYGSIIELEEEIIVNGGLERKIQIGDYYVFTIQKTTNNTKRCEILAMETSPQQVVLIYEPKDGFKGTDEIEVLIKPNYAINDPDKAQSRCLFPDYYDKRLLKLKINVKEELENKQPKEIIVKMYGTQLFEYQLGFNSNIIESAITKDPVNAELNVIEPDDYYSGVTAYKYQPKGNFKGKDIVELNYTPVQECATPPMAKESFRFTFTVF